MTKKCPSFCVFSFLFFFFNSNFSLEKKNQSDLRNITMFILILCMFDQLPMSSVVKDFLDVVSGFVASWIGMKWILTPVCPYIY